VSDVPVSNFGDSGVDVTRLDRNMTYLYGLSDFFTFMFEDEETTNLILESNAITSSEVYSRFLQLSSSLSLESIQTFTSSSIKLLLLKSTDKDPYNDLKFTVNLPIEDVSFLANRPFLPTESLEKNVDFRVTRKDLTSSYIQFARPIEEYRFSVRMNSEGISEYAIWMTDVLIDEQLVQRQFGNLIQLTPDKSSETFSNFVYGLYYVYTKGPTLGLLKRGLNLVLGAPLARGDEQVLDIRNYLDSDQYLVITDQNQYLLPFGLKPSVETGDIVSTGDLLAEWIELKDYINDGDWWINASIPSSLIKAIPPGQRDRFAVEGSPYDYLMRNYLAKNSFLVRVRVDSFKNIQNFVQITDIINKAKPTHTQPVYVWMVPSDLSDSITLNELVSLVRFRIQDLDYINPPIEFFRRDNFINPIDRGGAFFLRSCAPVAVTHLMGEDLETGEFEQDTFDEAGDPIYISGVRAYKSFLTPPTSYEVAWMKACTSRGSFDWNGWHSKIAHLRNVDYSAMDGTPVHNGYSEIFIPFTSPRIVALHTTRRNDLAARMDMLNVDGMAATEFPSFTISGSPGYLAANYNALFTKGIGVAQGGLGAQYPRLSYEEFKPDIGDIRPTDLILVKELSHEVFAVYWVTSNRDLKHPSLIPVESFDPLKVQYTIVLNRQSLTSGTNFYLTRGGALQNPGDVMGSYVDADNTIPIPVNRSGAVVKHVVRA